MNHQLLQTLLPSLLSMATPHVAAVLNDPRPERRWLRVLIALVLVLVGAALQLWQSGQWSLDAYVRAVGVLFVGSQVAGRLVGAHEGGEVQRVVIHGGLDVGLGD